MWATHNCKFCTSSVECTQEYFLKTSTKRRRKMLKIQIIANNVANSPITYNGENRGPIKELPEKLRLRVIEVARDLNNTDVGEIQVTEECIILSHEGKKIGISTDQKFLKPKSVVPFIEAMNLLHWYLGPHIYGKNPGTVGGQDGCHDCHCTQPGGIPHSHYCAYAHCPSHAKWAEIIDGYEPPVNPNEGALGRMMWETLERHQEEQRHQQLPLDFGEKANEWAKKG